MSWQAAFAQQARACRALGSPLTGALCDLLAGFVADDRGPIGQRVRGWPGDLTPNGASVPLRLCGSLHGLVLDGSAPDLAAAYAGTAPLAPAVIAAMRVHEARVLDWLDQAPQTNEVGRSAVLIAAAWFLGRLAPGVRFDLLELGASAGLNLNFPRYRLALPEGQAAPLLPGGDVTLRPEWRGAVPASAPVAIGSARGVDLHPLAPGLRLLAYIWPDQPDRLARARTAMAVAERYPMPVDQGDAADWLEAQLAAPPVGRIIYHTIAAQYFPADSRARIEAALHRASAAATPHASLAHVSFEADPAHPHPLLALRLWDGQSCRMWRLGRASPHVTWIDWQPEEIIEWSHP